MHAALDSPLRHTLHVKEDRFVLSGTAPEHVDPSYVTSDNPIRYGEPGAGKSMVFEGQLAVTAEDGQVIVDSQGIHLLGQRLPPSISVQLQVLMAMPTCLKGREEVSRR